MRKIAYFLICAAAMALSLPKAAKAQNVSKDVDIMYYFGCREGNYITASGGLLSQKMESALGGYDSRRWNGNFSLGIQHYFQKHLGIGVGVSYNPIRLDSIPASGYVQSIGGAVDENGRAYEHRTLFHDFSEKAKIHALSLDAKVFYQANLCISWKFFAAAGLALQMYPKSSYSTQGSLETTAFYDEYKLTIASIKNHNIYTSSGFSGKYSLEPNLGITAQAGFLYAISPRLDAFLALDAMWRLVPLPGNSSAPLYDPDCMSAGAYKNVKYNGMLESEAAPKIAALSAGVSLGVRLRISKDKKFDFDEFRHVRRVQEVEDFNFKRVRRQDFDKVQHRRREIADSIEIAQEERRIREVKEAELRRQQRVKDSLEKVAAAAADSLARIQQEDSTVSIALADSSINGAVSDISMLESAIAAINKNYCSINRPDLANYQELSAQVDTLAAILARNSDVRILIKGHTCNKGALEINKAMGMQRAQNMAKVLISKGAPQGQIRCESLWWKEPLAPNTSEAGRSINRRVELTREN